MSNALALLTPLLSSILLLRALRIRGIVESSLFVFCLFSVQIVTFGHILSYTNRLGDLKSWSILGLMAVLATAAMIAMNKDLRQSIVPMRYGLLSRIRVATADALRRIKNLSRFDKLILIPLISTVFMLGVLNLTVVVFTAPHHWDGITCHLARAAYYIQHGNTRSFDANYWAHVSHPDNPVLLLIYSYLVAGHHENLVQLPQYIAYWVAACSVYAIARKTGNKKAHSVFAAMVSALLVDWLMQATTTQIDLIMSAYFGTVVYSLFAFRETNKWKYLGFAALGIGLCIGTKATAILVMPSIALIASYILFQSGINLKERLRNSSFFAGCTVVAVCIIALPAGYIENIHHFGHPVGPKEVRMGHSFEGKSIGDISKNGTKNLMRFGSDFWSLDGIRPYGPGRAAQSLMKSFPEQIGKTLDVDLENPDSTILPFAYQKIPMAHEDHSYWGVFGFGLIWVMVFLSLMGIVKSKDLRVLSLSAVVFLVCQAYAGPYDPWRGRYFTVCAVFAVPVVAASLRTTNRIVQCYLLVIVMVGCASALSAVLFRMNSPLVAISSRQLISPIFRMDRMEQLTRNRTEFLEPLARFEQLVPHHATVAVCLAGNSFEYPLFGEKLTRTILPINSFEKGLQPIPEKAEYLLYDSTFPDPSKEDNHLGTGWHLRRLDD